MKSLLRGPALAVIVMLTLFSMGWYVRGAIDAKKEVKQLQADKKDTAKAIDQAIEASVKIDSVIHDDHDRIDPMRQEAAQRLAKPTYPKANHDQHPTADHPGPAILADQVDPADSAPVLDARTVRLLNAARSGAELRTAGSRNEQEPTAAGTGR